MKSAIFFVTAIITVAYILLSSVTTSYKDSVARVIEEQHAGQFLHYVSAFNELWDKGKTADGDASSRIFLPSWLPRDSSIQLRISSGTGYVFMPSVPGFYKQLIQQTDNNAHFGLSDDTGISTPAGRLTRPGFIPAGYVVYVR